MVNVGFPYRWTADLTELKAPEGPPWRVALARYRALQLTIGACSAPGLLTNEWVLVEGWEKALASVVAGCAKPTPHEFGCAAEEGQERASERAKEREREEKDGDRKRRASRVSREKNAMF